LSDAERRAYILADNKLAQNAGWDRELLAIELQGVIDLDFDVELTGFSLGETEIILDEARESALEGADPAAEDQIPAYDCDGPSVSRPGDLWSLGRHRLVCGDARDVRAYANLLGQDSAQLIFTDPPYNVPIDGHVCGSGRIRHREFSMGAGEMDKAVFAHFLAAALTPAAERCRDGAIAFVCMDWRHMSELLAAAEEVFSELKNLCVWNKTNGGMGTFYRSKHELIFVFKKGSAPHLNTFGLGDTGRYRTNVWDYPGVNNFRSGRLEELALHPTVKPVALVAHADKAHRWPRHRFTDARGVGRVILLPAHIGLDIGRRHYPDVMAKLEQLARPMMGRTTGFQPDNRRGQLGEEDKNILAPERLGNDRAPTSVNAVNVKNMLSQIKANGRDRR
jgi:DNA modification methylase